MARICLPNHRLRDQLAVATRFPDIVGQAVVWDAEPVPDGVADVELWVPAFLHNDRDRARTAIAHMPRLKVVQTQSAGVEVFVDLMPDGVALCDARGAHGTSTSEWALAVILASLRELPRFERARQAGRWDYGVTDELAGKSVLIVGAGDVGMSLARRIEACEARTVLVARTARDGVHGIDEVDSLLPDADVVVLFVPLTPATRGMVDAAFLARMKDGALLVNGARGPVVDTDALVAELTSGRLRAAADVVEPEPLPSGHPLWSAPNFLLTPHVGGSVRGAPDRILAVLAAQIDRFLTGEPMQNVVRDGY
jgi:phosphoglycerate dehydrogenase-like enzyme